MAMHTVPTGLSGVPPSGPAMPVVGEADVGAADARARRCAISSAVSSLTAPCCVERRALHAEHLLLHLVGVGDDVAEEIGGAAGDVGEAMADEAAGARLGHGERRAALARAARRRPPPSSCRPRRSRTSPMRSRSGAPRVAAAASPRLGGRPATVSAHGDLRKGGAEGDAPFGSAHGAGDELVERRLADAEGLEGVAAVTRRCRAPSAATAAPAPRASASSRAARPACTMQVARAVLGVERSRRKPGAVPSALGMIVAPSGKRACLRLFSGMTRPMAANIWRMRSATACIEDAAARPATAAIVSVVRSSAVGPRPPVEMTTSACATPRARPRRCARDSRRRPASRRRRCRRRPACRR